MIFGEDMSLRKLLLIGVLLPCFGVASTWSDMWSTKNQQSQLDFDNGMSKEAANKFDNSKWKGAANYEAGDFKEAYNEFKKDSSATGLYNQGNALTHMGDYKGAIKAFEEAIEKCPDFGDAKANLEVAKELDKQKDQNKDDQNNDDNGSGGDNDQGNQDKKDQKDNQDKKENDDKSQSDDKKNSKDSQDNKQGDKNKYQPENKDKQDGKDQPDNKDKQDGKDQPDNKDNQGKKDDEHGKGDPKDLKQGDTDKQGDSPAQIGKARQKEIDDKQQNKMLAMIDDDPGGLLRNKFKRDYQKIVEANSDK